MNYDKIWAKVLSPDEVVKREFSFGRGYLHLRLAAVAGFWLASVVLVFIVFSFLKSPPYTPVFFSLALGVLFGAYGFGTNWYLKTANAYAFTNKRVLVHRGWLSTSIQSISYDKITQVAAREPFFERVVMGVGDIVVDTANEDDEITLKYVENPYEIKRELDTLRTV